MQSVETRERQVPSLSRDFNNFAVLHGLVLALHDLDSRKQETLQELIAKFRFPAFVAPDGHGIEIEPNYAESREVPLDVEVFDEVDEDWHGIHHDSEDYDRLVRYHREFEPFFVGHSIEQETFVEGETETYVYSVDHNARVQVTPETVFRLVELPK